MQPLPIDSYLAEITRTLGARGALVLVAEPGAGKTTRVAPAIAKAGILAAEQPQIILLQPRRVAARAAAERIAAENGWRVGENVGYHVRFEKRLTTTTTIRVLTEGILTRQLVDDPFLDRVGCIILDEFHERSLHTDVSLALVNEVRQTVRPDLKIVVMSATMDAGPVAAFLVAPAISVPGRTFPITITYTPPAAAGYRPLFEHVGNAVLAQLATQSAGDILVFLPGGEEIRRVEARLRDADAASRFAALVVPLFGAMTLEEQQRAILPDPGGRRKVILATNIAETSLTIEGVTTVIDAGLARVASYDGDRGLDRLELKRISQASATQRAGRAGRLGPGLAIRLWSEREHKHLRPFELPEIKRVDLAQTVLALHAWGKSDPRAFGWFETPNESAMAAAETLLAMLGAIAPAKSDAREFVITPLGRRMLEIPAHPRIARLLIAAIDAGATRAGAAIAALLSEKDILRREGGGGAPSPRTQSRSDILVRLMLLEDVERSKFAAYWKDRGVDVHAARQVARARDEFLRLLGNRGKVDRASDESQLLQLILTACPDRVVRRRSNDPWSGVMVGGGGVTLAKESAVIGDEFYVALEARHDERGKSRQALVTIASGIDRGWLGTRREKAAEYDETRDRVVGVTREIYADLVVSEERHGAVDDAAAAAGLSAIVRQRAAEIVAADESVQHLLARVELLRQAMPEKGFPEFDVATLGEILATLTPGKRSVAEVVAGGKLVEAIKGELQYPLDRILDTEAPETIEVPTGNHIRIQYARGQSSILAVRIQELFGWRQTPRIAGGRVPLLLHLLSPAYRPVQITNDLASFWARAYFEVRKDLRADYPKHSWPEDPLTAKPEAKGSRRRM